MNKEERYPLEDRWSWDIAEPGFTPVPMMFLKNYAKIGIKAADAMIIVHIMARKWDAKLPFPSMKTLSEELGLSESQLRARIAALEKKKLIKRVRRYGTSSLFDPSGLISAIEDEMAKPSDEMKRSVNDPAFIDDPAFAI